METGVWNGGGFATTKSGLEGPVQSTVGVGGTALTGGGDTGERGGEPGEKENYRGDEANHGGQSQVQPVVNIGSFERVSFCSEEAGQVENVQERHLNTTCCRGRKSFHLD